MLPVVLPFAIRHVESGEPEPEWPDGLSIFLPNMNTFAEIPPPLLTTDQLRDLREAGDLLAAGRVFTRQAEVTREAFAALRPAGIVEPP